MTESSFSPLNPRQAASIPVSTVSQGVKAGETLEAIRAQGIEADVRRCRRLSAALSLSSTPLVVKAIVIHGRAASFAIVGQIAAAAAHRR
jgi:hypothetical protein